MKKLLLIAVSILLCQGAIFAQKAKNVKEQDVPSRYVKDFQRQAANATKVQWTMLDSVTYEVNYETESHAPQAIVFTNKGFETHYFIEEKWYPQAIKDTVHNRYPKHKITTLYARNVKNKVTYQTRIAKTKGLFKKKESDIYLLNFEANGQFISEEKR